MARSKRSIKAKINKYKAKLELAKGKHMGPHKYNLYKRKIAYYKKAKNMHGGAEENLEFNDNLIERARDKVASDGIVAVEAKGYEIDDIKARYPNGISDEDAASVAYYIGRTPKLAEKYENINMGAEEKAEKKEFQSNLNEYNKNMNALVERIKNATNLELVNIDLKSQFTELMDKINSIKPQNVAADTLSAELIKSYEQIMANLIELEHNKNNFAQSADKLTEMIKDVGNTINEKKVEIENKTQTTNYSEYDVILGLYNYILDLTKETEIGIYDIRQLNEIKNDKLIEIIREVISNQDKYCEVILEANRDHCNKLFSDLIDKFGNAGPQEPQEQNVEEEENQ